MRLKPIKWGLVLIGGWLGILVSAAVILPCTNSKAIAFPILVLMLVWLLLSVVTLFSICIEHGGGLGASQTKRPIYTNYASRQGGPGSMSGIAFHEKAGRSQVDSFCFWVDTVFWVLARRVASVAILPSALLRERS